MENIVKTWQVIYKHPLTEETIKTLVYGKDKKEAVKNARKNNVPTMNNTLFWEIVSVSEFLGK